MTSTSSIGRISLASLMSVLLLLAPGLSQSALANAQQAVPSSQHVVSLARLRRDLKASAAARQANVKNLQNFLSTAKARRALKSAGMNYKVVRRAVPLLSNHELASLAARADRAHRQFRAGALTNQQLTYIIIALATAVVVIIVVAH